MVDLNVVLKVKVVSFIQTDLANSIITVPENHVDFLKPAHLKVLADLQMLVTVKAHKAHKAHIGLQKMVSLPTNLAVSFLVKARDLIVGLKSRQCLNLIGNFLK